MSASVLAIVPALNEESTVAAVVQAIHSGLGADVLVVLLHLSLGERSRHQQLSYVRSLIKDEAHAVVMGDMNSHLSGLLFDSPLADTPLVPAQNAMTFPLPRAVLDDGSQRYRQCRSNGRRVGIARIRERLRKLTPDPAQAMTPADQQKLSELAGAQRKVVPLEPPGWSFDPDEKWYEINRKVDGYYVVFQAKSDPAPMVELSRVLSLADEVIRHKVLRIPAKVYGPPKVAGTTADRA